MYSFSSKNKNQGYTLVETLIAVAIFVGVSVGIYGGFSKILALMNVIRNKEVVTNLINEQFEIARNLPYTSVGTVGGVPAGLLPQSQSIVRDGKTYTVNIVVRNIDDPFDGTLGGSPNDLSPADMKLIEVEVLCASCKDFTPVSFTTKIAPKNLETASTNGALVVRVFDSSGLPVSLADVNVVNTSVIPNINIVDKTDVSGMLTIVDAPPSSGQYRIYISKSGYSSDRTHPVGASGNPNPSKPDATVVLQQVTQVSFTIDKVSTVYASAVNNQCVASSSFGFDFFGTKLIGTSPNVIKYSQGFTTNGSGNSTLSNIEWDTYNITGSDSTRDIIGTNPLLSLGVPPNSSQNIQIITETKNGRRLLVVVRDQATGLPISDATVSVTGPSSYSTNSITSQGFFNQTDWSGGDGQASIGDSIMYYSSDGNVDVSTSPGDVTLKMVSGSYVASAILTSSSFDTGAGSNFRQITWKSATQPPQTGSQSVRFQVATNNDNATWNFVGPDGTSSTYFTTSNQDIGSTHNGNRYLKYKIFLSTADSSYTPSISDVSFTYTSDCVPPGQVSFSGLATGNYTISITKTGYLDTSRIVNVASAWQKEEFVISP